MESKQEKKTVSFLHQIEEFEKEFQDKEMEMIVREYNLIVNVYALSLIHI